ncbi:MAG: prolyl oligopeptidase family serine peptidase, partial [Fimbriimonas ginsengisoli]|nr:prolyl oligopeptidase family serine peptidase [Fimbriimonas ginsengisoli]
MQPYYIADGHKSGCDWLPQRDLAFMRLWGRLGYDPRTPDSAFDETLRELYGPQGAALATTLRAASRIIPTALTVTCIGPDHRNHAPELESGGDMAAFFDRSGYDSHVFMSGKEMLAYQATGGVDGRLTPLDAASLLEADVAAIGAAQFGADVAASPESLRRDEALHAVNMLGNLGRYYAARLRGGVELGLTERAAGPDAQIHRASAGGWMQYALAAWQQLSESADAKFYKPFTDRLRMGRNDYHWRQGLAAIQSEADRLGGGVAPTPIKLSSTPSAPEPELMWSADNAVVKCTLRGESIERAWLLHKPLPSSTFFHKSPMIRAADGSWTATIPRLAAGHALAADVQQGGRVTRIPSWRNIAPYRLVPSQQTPTPLYYSTAEALRYLKPEVLTPEDYGLLIIGSRGWNFHHNFDAATQRNVLDAVERGITLLVLQQDYTSGRYPLAWLGPELPKLENARLNIFDPAGALGLAKFEAEDIIWQRFVPAPGWEVLGNGGMAHARRGKGEIWLVQARLMQRLHIPAAAKTLLALLRTGTAGKQVVIVDHDSEGAPMSTSVLPDFLNAHDIPFVTIGEVIADKQGVDSRTPIAGRIDDDNVLGGKGPAMVRGWLDRQVRSAAHVDPPRSRAEQVERQVRQKAELMRCLGLDPLPERTPLNARITGTLDRGRYRIEKLVFESRPGFLVTALLYIPKAEPGTRFPVIVNPHGHWRLKKAEPVVQSRLISQALSGYLALVVDSPGWSFEGDAPIERRWEGTHDDPTLTLSAGSATGIYVWDLMRGLDYLETRPEADMQHVGITGTSGGGLATVYAFAADERFTAAVPVCYACSLELQPNNGCLCNHVPGTLQVGDRADVLGIRAPAPVMLIGASNDSEFPPDAMKRSGEKLRALYAIAGAADNARCQIFESGHDYSQPMREAALGFFDQHLRGRGNGKPVPEPAVDIAG